MLTAAGNGPAAKLLDRPVRPTRRLYKRVAQYSLFQRRSCYELLARTPVPLAGSLCGKLRCRRGTGSFESRRAARSAVRRATRELEVEFQIDVSFPKEDCYRHLGDISPVVENAGPRAVRRLRETSADLCPSAVGRRLAIAEHASRSDCRGSGNVGLSRFFFPAEANPLVVRKFLSVADLSPRPNLLIDPWHGNCSGNKCLKGYVEQTIRRFLLI